MPSELDELDRQILSILADDGRLPVAQVAERVGLSRPAVAERIERLNRSGVIRGTTTVVAPGAVGRSLTAFITARRRDPEDRPFSEALAGLIERDDVLELHTVAGEDCYLLKVRTDGIASLNGFVNLLQAHPFTLTTRTTIVMETYWEKVGGVTLDGGAHAEG